MRYVHPARIIPRIEGADDPHGNPTVIWGTPVSTRCNLTRQTKAIQADGSVLTIANTMTALFPPTVSIKAGDRVEVDLPTGETLKAEVTNVVPVTMMAGWVVALKVEMERAD